MNSGVVFERSEYVENIHYIDLFTINGLNWAILGHGKSQAAMHASQQRREADLGRDCLALFVINGRLHGRYDPGMISQRDDDLFAPHPIDIVAYCLSEASTVHIFGDDPREIVSCKPELLALFAIHHQYPAYALPHEVSPGEWQRLCDPERRVENLLDLLQQDVSLPILLVPWMESVERKGDLYLQYGESPIKPVDDYIQGAGKSSE